MVVRHPRGLTSPAWPVRFGQFTFEAFGLQLVGCVGCEDVEQVSGESSEFYRVVGGGEADHQLLRLNHGLCREVDG